MSEKYPLFKFDSSKIWKYYRGLGNIKNKYLYLKYVKKEWSQLDYPWMQSYEYDARNQNYELVAIGSIDIELEYLDAKLKVGGYNKSLIESGQTIEAVEVEKQQELIKPKIKKCDRIYKLVSEAQKYTEHPPDYWKEQFDKKFPEGYYTELNRIEKAYYENKKININGMSFYHSRKGRKKTNI